jgi:hypothetical protein
MDDRDLKNGVVRTSRWVILFFGGVFMALGSGIVGAILVRYLWPIQVPGHGPIKPELDLKILSWAIGIFGLGFVVAFYGEPGKVLNFFKELLWVKRQASIPGLDRKVDPPASNEEEEEVAQHVRRTRRKHDGI